MVKALPWTGEDDRAVQRLVSEVAADPFGNVTPSVYETARLVVLAPWLTGHLERIRFVLSAQRPDGAWGSPDGYDVVPTLSAAEALLTMLRRPDSVPAREHSEALWAVSRGLTWLFDSLGAQRPVPDTIAAELIVPWLIAEVNGHLDRLGTEPLTGLDVWRGQRRLGLPAGMDSTTLNRLRSLVHSEQPIPEKAWHSLEVFGADAHQAGRVQPVGGVVCGSPAATAAWLGPAAARAGHHESLDFLRRVQARHGGPVPGVAPINVFEPAWIVAMLADARAEPHIPMRVAHDLEKAVSRDGAPAGTGLPADSDDTAAALYALAKLGRPGSPDSLWRFELDGYFCCFPGEHTPSTSTNAHILDALHEYASFDPLRRDRFTAAIRKIVHYLLAQQETDGSWWDKWHASPYYATACCAQALARAGGDTASSAVRQAISWVLGSQREDGSWGRWTGTVEETSYAVQTLLHCAGGDLPHALSTAVARAGTFLRAAGDTAEHPPLWHDKDLYTPVAVVQAARLAALRLIATHGPVRETTPPAKITEPVA